MKPNTNQYITKVLTKKENEILIDTEDFEKIKRYSWCVSKTGYAVANNGKYVFQTHAINSTAKTPLGAFKEDEIENDITKVLEVLKDY